MAEKRKYEIALYPKSDKPRTRPIHRAWRWAYSKRQARMFFLRDLQEKIKSERGKPKTKALELMELVRSDFPMIITDVTNLDEGTRIDREIQYILDEMDSESIMEERRKYETCPECGGSAEEDYCPSCGWQRFTSSINWYLKLGQANGDSTEK